MLLLWTLSFFVAVITAEPDSVQIENKNINVNVNINAKEIAEELWKIIELHLKNDENSITRRLLQEDAVNELEEIIRKVVEPTRRLNPTAEIELAKNYRRIVRRAIPIFGWDDSSFDRAVNVDDVVDDMIWATETLIREPSETSASADELAKGQLLVTDHDDETWSFTLRRIMKSLKNIENSLQSFRQQLIRDRLSRTNFADFFSFPSPYIKRTSKASGRSKNNNFNENYNVLKNVRDSDGQPLNNDEELYDDYRNDESDSADLFDEDLHIPYAVADSVPRRQKAFMNNVIDGYASMVGNDGMQDVIPKKKKIFSSSVESPKNDLKTKNNFLSFKKRPEKRRPANYINSDLGKAKRENESNNKNINKNQNVISYSKKNNYYGKSKQIKRPNDDDDYENHI